MIKVEYGKSMYGGWYANWFDAVRGEWVGAHANTKKELTAELNVWLGSMWEYGRRFDN